MTDRYDVLVAGGGIAGIAAAISAARLGKRVLLIEREYLLGGMATLGLVTIYLPLCDGEGRQLVYGLGEELLKLSIKHGAEANYPSAWLDGGTLAEKTANRYLTQFNPHLFALSAEKLLLELGVEILYGTQITDTITEKDRITAVEVHNKTGKTMIEFDTVVDCTGDADVCALAGAPTALHKGGNGLAGWYYYHTNGKIALKMFGLADVSEETAKKQGDGKEYSAAKTKSIGNMRFSGVDGAELSKAVLKVHGQVYEDILKARSQSPDLVPVTLSTIPLVRMSRRLCGEYTLDEAEDRKSFPDSIGMTGDWRKRGPAFEIPYGTLYCKEFSNLLAAGRCISVTDAMWDITRVIPPCAVTGQAAGAAAALSLGGDVRKLDINALQDTLKSQYARLRLNEVGL